MTWRLVSTMLVVLYALVCATITAINHSFLLPNTTSETRTIACGRTVEGDATDDAGYHLAPGRGSEEPGLTSESAASVGDEWTSFHEN